MNVILKFKAQDGWHTVYQDMTDGDKLSISQNIEIDPEEVIIVEIPPMSFYQKLILLLHHSHI